ncbi:uncharacterized protein LOC110870447 [Helianthus annuus]|uniref:uncharacterized protein LOC110870447 n=1 Tax=Helianthus annuus TaxID=4232 RepID=UPI000B909246|nr:uncharacterized protein LOC110870447 [Helianthus annuus]
MAIHGGNNNSNNDQIIPLKKSITGVWKDIGSVETALAKIGINIKENLVKEGNTWKWRTYPGGSFSVKQIRLDIDNITAVDVDGGDVFRWNCWAPPKVKYLLWRALLGRVASKVGLARRGVPLVDNLCPRCGLYDEDSDHIFVNCLWAKCVWWNILAWIRIPFLNCNNLKEFISQINQSLGDKTWKKIVYTTVSSMVWRLWKARNDKVFNGSFIPVSKTVELIKEDSFLLICNRSKLKKPTWENWRIFDLIDIM